jgi:hypothetical protein
VVRNSIISKVSERRREAILRPRRGERREEDPIDPLDKVMDSDRRGGKGEEERGGETV